MFTGTTVFSATLSFSQVEAHVTHESPYNTHVLHTSDKSQGYTGLLYPFQSRTLRKRSPLRSSTSQPPSGTNHQHTLRQENVKLKAVAMLTYLLLAVSVPAVGM